MVPYNMEKVKIRLVLRKVELLWQMAGGWGWGGYEKAQ